MDKQNKIKKSMEAKIKASQEKKSKPQQQPQQSQTTQPGLRFITSTIFWSNAEVAVTNASATEANSFASVAKMTSHWGA